MPNEPTECGGKVKPSLSEGGTPYGYWHCSNGAWVWIPEIGFTAPSNLWNRILHYLMIKK